MTSPSAPRRAALLAALLFAATLPGCLTQWLWEESGDGTALMETESFCRIHEVRGDFLSGAEGTRPRNIVDETLVHAQPEMRGRGVIEIDFTVEREKDTPADIDEFTGDHLGTLRLEPPDTEPNWFALPGAEMFTPEFWEFGVFRASYFSNRESSVPVVFVGEVKPAELGEVRKRDDAPVGWRDLPAMRPAKRDTHHLVLAALRSFAGHDWPHLLTGGPGPTDPEPIPLAWLDEQGRQVTKAEMQDLLLRSQIGSRKPADLEKYTLLGRVEGDWGETLFVRVPLPVLVQGTRLALKREGDRVLWRRTQVWRGTVRAAGSPAPRGAGADLAISDDPATAVAMSRPAKSVPLLADRFVYTYAEEYDDADSVLATIFKVVLTPPAVLIDFAVRTSVFYRDIIRWMSSGHDQKWEGPVAPEKHK